jgi:hypothetical protein
MYIVGIQIIICINIKMQEPVWVVSVSSSTLGETVVSTVNVSVVTGISEVLLLEMLTSIIRK